MASLIYNSFWETIIRGDIDLDTVTVKAMLTTAAYTENRDTHDMRDDVTNEVAAGAGYTAGGETVTVTITRDNPTDTVVITLGQAVWTAPSGQTLTARKAVYYVARGGAASADDLIAVNDFGSDKIASGGTLTVNASTITLDNSGA